MRLTLSPHPDAPSPAVGVDVDVVRGRGGLTLRYLLAAPAGAVRIPDSAAAARADGLWRHTCFEAFVRPGEGDRYIELNLSPSTAWAAYRFDGYRSGMAPLDIPPPRIEVRQDDGRLQLDAAIDLAAFDPDAAWRLGLSAVVEAIDGSISYWALAHPPGKPDFHHGDCFALELPAGRLL